MWVLVQIRFFEPKKTLPNSSEKEIERNPFLSFYVLIASSRFFSSSSSASDKCVRSTLASFSSFPSSPRPPISLFCVGLLGENAEEEEEEETRQEREKERRPHEIALTASSLHLVLPGQRGGGGGGGG